MSNAHDLPEPIQWHEGMLLGPQHFQQLSLRQEELLHYQVQLAAPYHWGVRHLKIDPVMLVDGQLRVLELEAVMPDGLVVTSLQHDISDQALDLEPFKQAATERPATVHLAVPARRSGGLPTKGELRRYDSIEGQPVSDQNTGETEMRIPRLRPRLSLMVGDTPPEKFTSFPLARISYEDETFTLGRFVPPQLRITPQSPIGELCAVLATRLREKAVLLAEKVKAPSVATRAPQLLETRDQVQALVGGLPQFEALLQSGNAHPFPLYVTLCGVVGGLARLGTALLPPVFDPYDHNDLFTTFSQATRFANRVINEGFIESFNAYPFSIEKGAFALKFDPSWTNRRLILGVRARSGATEREAAAWLENALIGTEANIPSMRARRVLGPPRKSFEGEEDLIPTPGVALFAVPAEPEFIVADESLMIFNPDDPGGTRGPAEIILYIRKTQQSADKVA